MADADGMKQKRDEAGGTSLAGHVASGTVWLGGTTAVTRVIGIVSQFLLMWILLPEHFGANALVQSITMFAQHLTNPGIEDVLLQKGKKLNRWASAAFWLSLACGLGGAVVMALAGAVVVATAHWFGNDAYGSPIILKMILIYALGAPINGMAMVPWVVLTAQLRFGRIAMLLLLEIFLQQSLMVLLALKGFGAYSFVIPMPLVAVIRTSLMWWSAKPPVKPQLQLYRWPKLISATGWVFGRKLLTTGTHHGDQVTLGVVYADRAINGYYQSAVSLTQQVVRVLCENLVQVLVPVLTSFKDDKARLEGAVSRACRALSSMVVPIAILQILLIGPLVRMIFPARWEPSIVLIQILSMSPLLFASAYPMMAMITATGRFRAAFFLSAINLLCFFALVIPGTKLGQAPGTATAVAVYYWLAAHLFAVTAFGSLQGIAVMHRAVWRALVCGAVAAIPGYAATRLLPAVTRVDQGVIIVTVAPIVLATFVFMLRLLDPESLSTLRHRLGGALGPIARRFFPRRATA